MGWVSVRRLCEGARLVGVLGVRSRVVRGGCVWCGSCIGVL